MRFSEINEEKRIDLLKQVPNLSDLIKLDKIFKSEGYELRLVGGVVRDLLQDKKPKDVDLASTATPDQMLNLAQKYKLKSIPTGLQHGTLTFVINSEPYEITTLRIDTETDGRHAQVEYTTDWKLDAERRDLTFNAMSMDLSGELYDYYGGASDLKNGTARFVGDPDNRITEDYLRILRYFRFQGRTATPQWDKETLVSIRNNVEGLNKISGERFWLEVSKILRGGHLTEILTQMNNTGVLDKILIPSNNISKITKIKNDTDDEIILLSVLLNSENEANELNGRYKLAAKERDKLLFLVKNKGKILNKSKALFEIIINKIDPEWIKSLLILQGNKSIAVSINEKSLPVFPITGGDLIANGIKPGPEMGKTLNKLKQDWLASGFALSKDELLNTLQ